MNTVRRSRRRRPGRRRLDGSAPGPGRPVGRLVDRARVRQRHPLHPRAHAWRCPAAVPVGACWPTSSPPGRRPSAAPSSTTPDGEVADVTIRPRRGGRALRTPPPPARPAPRRRRRAGRRGRAARDGRDVAAPRRLGPRGGVVGRPAAAPASSSTAGLTVGADGIRSRVADEVGARTYVAGRERERGALPLRRGPAGATATSGTTATAPAGRHPDQRRSRRCVFVGTTPARMRRLRRLGIERAFAELLVAVGPAAAERARGPAGRPGARLGGPARLRARVLGSRVGARRGRRLLQGPDHHPRHHRRTA